MGEGDWEGQRDQLQSEILNLTGELTMAFGLLSLWCLAITAIPVLNGWFGS